MANVERLPVAAPAGRLNVTERLATFARTMPDSIAVVCPHRRASRANSSQRGDSGARYNTISFADLETEVARIANGFAAWGVPKGTRLALLVKPGIEFVTLVFALLRAGMVIVLVDPGLGRRNLIRCLAEAEPEGFVAIGSAQAARIVLRNRFPRARWNVTVGRRWFWHGMTLDNLRSLGESRAANEELATKHAKTATSTCADDPAAIIFTSGSTGVPKGVLYTQQMFDIQVAEIQSMYGIEPGGVDLACFPLFALFNAAMGVTTVLPEMDFSRPALADPKKLLAAANDWRVTQAFASPAVWRLLSEYCAGTGEQIKSLFRVFSCGAPVPAEVLRATLTCVGDRAKMHTPYGATECLPIATIEAAEVLGETATRTDQGGGVCVGRKCDTIDWRIIRITDEAILSIEHTEVLPCGEIGELIVRGPQVSPRYVTRAECNATAKIGDSRAGRPVNTQPWHRTGDVGYFDAQSRFWYCGRKSQRVETLAGPLYTEKVEAIFNMHSSVRRCALVGIGPRENQIPVLIVEAKSPITSTDRKELDILLQNHYPSNSIGEYMVVNWPLPVDVRHNAKINRELLASFAAKRLKA